jgi:pimeloyl-ACP methyl ester carboxylesterase
MADFLTRFGFPGASNGPEPAPQIKYLPRIGKNPGDIEYVAHVYLSPNASHTPNLLTNCSRTPGARLIVFVCHGRGRGLDKRGVNRWAELAHQEGVSVVLHNYPGYGTTPGPRTEAQLCEDLLQLAEHIRNEEWATGAELVVLGNSIGTGPALWMATQRQLQIKKLVLVSPYTSVVPLVPLWLVKQLHEWLNGSPDWLNRSLLKWLKYFSDPSGLSWIQGSKYDPFPPKKVACKLDKDAEVLILHGAVDDVIPVAHGKVC